MKTAQNASDQPAALLAMSGGVDSSTCAILLAEQGFRVSGMTFQLLPDMDDAIASARAVADQLGIDFSVLPMEDAFKQRVVTPFCEAYLAGETPNPCAICNPRIKFAALDEQLEAGGFAAYATGHYARVERDKTSGRWLLKRALDEAKDQTYFLYALTQTQLSRLILPLGMLTKKETRERAAAAQLPAADRADSQDICFIPDGDYRTFLHDRGYCGKPGPIITIDGAPVGQHEGLENYTIGQRKGLGVATGQPMFVCSKMIASNTLVIGARHASKKRGVVVSQLNFIAIDGIEALAAYNAEHGPLPVQAKTHYRSAPLPATIEATPEGTVELRFLEAQVAPAPGQVAVFYDGDTVVGGGIITGSLHK